MKRLRPFMVLLLLLCSVTLVFGASQTTFTQMLEDKENRGRISGTMKAGVDPFLYFSVPTPSTSQIVPAGAIPPLAGDIDLDNNTEMIILRDNKVQALEFDGSSLVVDHLDVIGLQPVGVPGLADVDGDGKEEIFVCGLSAGTTRLVGIDFNLSTSSFDTLFSVNIGAPSDKCYTHNSASLNSDNATYAPTIAQVNGTWYAYWLVRDTSQTSNIERIEMDGTRVTTNLEALGDPTTCDAQGNQGIPSFNNNLVENPHGRHGYPTDVMKMAMCQNTNGDPILYIPAQCSRLDNADTRGIVGVRPDVMVTEGRFGYVAVQGTSSAIMSNPSCVFDGTEFQVGVAHGNGFHAISLISETGSINTLISSTDSVDVLSDIVQGEYLSASVDNDDDVCGYYYDQGDDELIIQCSEIGETDAGSQVFDWTTQTGGGGVPWGIATSGFDSNFAGDTNGDLLLPFGLYQSEAEDGLFENDGFTLATRSYIGSLGQCSSADVNNDGFLDVLCQNGQNFTLALATSINQKPVLTSLGKDVAGTMCRGNQTFQALPSQYTDEEADDVRLVADCTNDGSFEVMGGFSTFGSTLEVKCEYLSDATFTSKVCLQDTPHDSDATQCIVSDTKVQDQEFCVVGDGIISKTINNVGEGDDIDGAAVQQDLSSSLNDIAESFGARSQASKDLVFVFLSLVLSLAVGSTNTILGLVMFGMLLAVFTFTGLVSPIYLISMVLLSIVGIFVFKMVQ